MTSYLQSIWFVERQMMTSLEKYILKNYVKSDFIGRFLHKQDNIASMFVKVGNKFGFDVPLNKSNPQYFYDLQTMDGVYNVCFIGYNSKNYSGIYMCKDKKLLEYNYMTHKLKNIGVDELSESELEKYNSYTYENIDNKELFLLDVIDGNRYYFDRDSKIYNNDFKEIDSNDSKYTVFVDLLSKIVQSVNV